METKPLEVELINVVTAAKMLGVSDRQVYQLMDNGILPYVQLPSAVAGATRRTRRLKKSEIIAFIDRHSTHVA